jgi:MraZ protein
MFRGLHEHSIDAKGRTTFPSRFREVLTGDAPEPQLALGVTASDAANADDTTDSECDTRLILTTGIERCLVAYTPATWEAFEARLATLSQFDPAVLQLKRIYVAPATECGIDKHGRILIPQMLREWAELGRDVVWAGMVTTIELWSKESWNKQVEAARLNPAEIKRALTELGL